MKPIFDFESAEKEDLSQGPSRASSEGRKNLLDHRWVWMALLVLVVGLFLHNTSLITLVGFMLGVVLFAWTWNRYALRNIHYYRRFHHRRAFPGEQVEVQILVENRKWLPTTWLQIEDEWPTAFGPADETAIVASSGPSMAYLVNIYSLRWYERVRRRFMLTARQRGVYPVGPVHVLSGDPFSLFEDDGTINRADTLIIYPEVKPIEDLGFDAKDPFGEVKSQQRLFEDPHRTMGTREYQSSDSFRHIHWKATARSGTLQTRLFEPTRTQSVVLCLNIASFDQQIRGVWPQMVEYVISVAASLASWAVEQEYAVGLVANATFAQTDRPLRTQPGRSRDQLANLLETMASISYFVTADYARFTVEESMRMPWGSTLVAITGYINESILASLLRLRESGRRVVLIVLGKTPAPDLNGIRSYHLPIIEAEPEEPPEVAETPRQRYLRDRARQTVGKAARDNRANASK